MEPREILLRQVKPGDRVRVSRDLTVDATDDNGIVYSGARYFRTTEGRSTITLLDRPLPPIPTDEGTVIRSKATGSVYVRIGNAWRGAHGHAGNPLFTRDGFIVLVPETEVS